MLESQAAADEMSLRVSKPLPNTTTLTGERPQAWVKTRLLMGGGRSSRGARCRPVPVPQGGSHSALGLEDPAEAVARRLVLAGRAAAARAGDRSPPGRAPHARVSAGSLRDARRTGRLGQGPRSRGKKAERPLPGRCGEKNDATAEREPASQPAKPPAATRHRSRTRPRRGPTHI